MLSYPLKRKSQKSRLVLSSAEMFHQLLTDSMDPDQTAPVGAAWSVSTRFVLLKRKSLF